MAKQILDTGAAANDNTGDTLRVGGQKIKDNFDEIYNALGNDGTNITFNASALNLSTLSDVNTLGATAGQYLQFNAGSWTPVTHEVDGTVTGDLIPDANVAYDLGSPTHAFRDLYLSSSSIHLGGLTVSASPTGLTLTNPDGTEFVPPADANTAENVVEPAIESTEDQTDVFFFQEFYPNISDLTAMGNWNTSSSPELSSTTIGADVIPHFPCIDPNQYADVLTSDPWSMLPGYEATIELVNRHTDVAHTLHYISPEDYANGDFTEGFIFHLTTIELVGTAGVHYGDTKEFTFQISSVLSETTMKSSLIPDQDLMYDLGSPDKRFRDLYISGSTIHFGTASMKSVNGQIQLSAPLAPVNPEVVVFEKNNGFRCHSSKQITFTEEIPGILMNYELRQTAVDTNHTPTLKIGLPSATVDTVVDFAADLTSSFPSGVGPKARYNRSGRIDFLDQTPGQSLGDFIEYTRGGWGPPVLAPGYTAELKLTYSDSVETKIEITNSRDVINSYSGNTWEIDGSKPANAVDLGYYKVDPTPADTSSLNLPKSEGWYTDTDFASGWAGEVHLVLGDGSTKIVYTSSHPNRDPSQGDFYTRSRYYGYLAFRGTDEESWWLEVKGLGPTYTDDSGVVQPRVRFYAYKAGGNSVVYTSGQDGNEFSIKNDRSISISGPGFTKVRESFNKGIDSYINFKVYRNTIEERELAFHGTYVFGGARPVPDVDSFWFASNQVIEMLPAAGSDLISRFAQNAPTRDRGWISKHTKVDFKMVKTDPKNKGDVLTSEGEQNLENKTLGKDGSPTYFDGSLIPTKDAQFDLGTPDNRFRDLYISSDSMHIGGTKLSTAGGTLQTFDVVFRGKLDVTATPDWNSFQFDGNPRKSTTITSVSGDIPYVVSSLHGASKFDVGYDAKLIAHLNEPVAIYKNYPNIEQFEEVSTYRSTADYSILTQTLSGFTEQPWVFSDFDNLLDISVYELEAGTKYKLVFKFMTGNWPVDIETTLCEWIILKDSLGNTTINATAFSKKIRTHYHTSFRTKFAFYDVNGDIDTTASMFVDGVGIEDILSYRSGNVPSTLPTNQFQSGNANTSPLFGSHLQHSYLQISGPGGFFVNALGLTAAHRPPIANTITHLYATIEGDSLNRHLRLYGTDGGAPIYLNPAHPSTDYDLNQTFLTEFKIDEAAARLSETSRTRPLAWDCFRHVISVDYSDKTSDTYAANTALCLNYNTQKMIQVNQRLDVVDEINSGYGSDLQWLYSNNMSQSRLLFFQSVHRPHGYEYYMPYPSIAGFAFPSFSYEDLVSKKEKTTLTANTKNLFIVDQVDRLDLSKIPYKETSVGLDQRLKPNFELEVRLYESDYTAYLEKPFVIYRQLSSKYYSFETTGQLLHLPDDNDSQGIILDSLGNLYFKARDENTIKSHFKQADKIKIVISSTASIREFSNFLDNIETDAAPEDSRLYLQSNTEIYAVNSENIGENCDIAAILAKANAIEIEIVKEIVDTTTTNAIANTNAAIANTKAEVTTIQNELAKSLRLTNLPVPTSNTAAGTLGDMVVDGNTLYICVTNDQWGKINLDFNW